MRPLLSPFPTLLSLEKEIYLTLWVSFVLRGDPINETITEMGLPRSPAQALALYSLCSPFFHVASPSRNLGLNSDREKIFLELCFLSVLQALMNGLFIYLFATVCFLSFCSARAAGQDFQQKPQAHFYSFISSFIQQIFTTHLPGLF